MKDVARLDERTVQQAEAHQEARESVPRKRRKGGGRNGRTTTTTVHPNVMKVAKAFPGVRNGSQVIRIVDERTVMVENRAPE